MSASTIIFLTPIAVLCVYCTVRMFKDLRHGLPLVGLLFFLGAVAPITELNDRLLLLWIEPIQQFRTILLAATSGFILAGLVAHAHRASAWRPSLPAALLIVVGIYAALIRIIHEGFASGAISLVFVLVTLVPPALLLSATIQDPADARAAMRPFAWAGLAWLAIAVVQYFVNQRFVFVQTGANAPHRFSGVSPNPQFTAVFLAIVGPMALFLSLNAPRQFYRVFWLGLFIGTIPLVVATGSRTGALMFMIGCLPGIAGRIGVAMLLVPPAALAAWLISQTFTTGKFAVDLSRIVSTENTRGQAWAELLSSGLGSPVIGVGIEGTEVSENSYLYGFAAYGGGMLVLLLALAASGARLALRLIAMLRRPNATPSRLAIYAASLIGAYLAGTVFEGYAVARINPLQHVWLLGCAIAAALVRFDRSADISYEELDAEGVLDQEPDETGEDLGLEANWG